MTTRETQIPSEMGVVIGEEEVPEEILRACRKARRKVAQEARQDTTMIYARPEIADDAVQRYKFEQAHKPALEEEAVRRGITVPELAYMALSGSEEGVLSALERIAASHRHEYDAVIESAYRLSEVFANVVDRLLRSRGDLLLSSFYQLPVPELGSCSNQRYQMSAG
jgi:hypothetical protein